MAGKKAGIEAGRAYVKAFLEDSEFRRGMKRWGDSLKSLGSKMAGFGIALGAAFVPAIQAAGRMSAVMASFETIFKSSTKEMGAWGDNLAKTLGRARTDVREFMTQTQGRLLAAGVDESTANEINKQLTGRAFDLAAFWDKDDATAFQAMQNALTGEMEMLKQFGIVIHQADVDAKLKALGLDPKSATQAEKVQARFALLLDRSSEQAGTAAREQGEYGSQLKRLQAQITDLSESIGMALLPTVLKLMTAASDIAGRFAAWAKDNPQLTTSIAGIAAALAGAGGVVWAAGAVAAVLSGPVGIIALTIALTAAVLKLAEAYGVFGTSAAEAARQSGLFQTQMQQGLEARKKVNDEANATAIAGGPEAIEKRKSQLEAQATRIQQDIHGQQARINVMQNETGWVFTQAEEDAIESEMRSLRELQARLESVQEARMALARHQATQPDPRHERFGDPNDVSPDESSADIQRRHAEFMERSEAELDAERLAAANDLAERMPAFTDLNAEEDAKLLAEADRAVGFGVQAAAAPAINMATQLGTQEAQNAILDAMLLRPGGKDPVALQEEANGILDRISLGVEELNRGSMVVSEVRTR